jgi:hypothetical protein
MGELQMRWLAAYLGLQQEHECAPASKRTVHVHSELPSTATACLVSLYIILVYAHGVL